MSWIDTQNPVSGAWFVGSKDLEFKAISEHDKTMWIHKTLTLPVVLFVEVPILEKKSIHGIAFQSMSALY